MKIEFNFNGEKYAADLSNPLDISIPLREGESNPNCYWAEPPVFETIVSGDFIGSVSEGGPVNYQKISITPHGNGTHTECYGHISADGATINGTLKKFHFVSELVSIEPILMGDDSVITWESLEAKISNTNIEGLIVRSLPNSVGKLARRYSGTNPPYFDLKALKMLANRNFLHLMVDLPSVDREVDGGKLLAHRNFWNFPAATRGNATITELIFVPDSVPDGLYLVNLQIISLETDACPSKPLLFPMSKI
jgi:kynurenine formamidase